MFRHSLVIICLFLVWIFGSPCAAKVINYKLIVMMVPGNPDGFPRPVIGVYDLSNSTYDGHGPFIPGVDRPFPGPLLRGNIGDTLNVTVWNMLDEEAISVHFHGLHMFQNPWMDGANAITDCGIPFGQTFTYNFELTQTGTFWYHSHTASQYADGLLGPLVVDYPSLEDDPVYNAWNYEEEHVLLLQDWFHEPSNEIVTLYSGPRFIFPNFTPQYPWPTSVLLINGRGLFNCSDVHNYNYSSCSFDTWMPCAPPGHWDQCIPIRPPFYGSCNTLPYPIDNYTCSGNTTRLRIINGASNAPIRFWIDRHNLTIVARDGIEIIPAEVPYLTIPIGQRIDAIVKCNQSPAYNYYMFVTTASGFLPPDAVIPDAYSYTYFTYGNDTAELIDSLDHPEHVNDPNYFHDNVTQEFFYKPLVPAISAPAYERIIIDYEVDYEVTAGYPLEQWLVNGIPFMMPHEPILQSVVRFGKSTEQIMMDSMDGSTNIIRLEANKHYEVVMFGNDCCQQHPWHLHGFTLEFVDYGYINRSALPAPKVDACGFPLPNASAVDWDSILKPITSPLPVLTLGDSFTVPASGYVVFRFNTTNQGPWIFHCHVDWHMALGMALVISVEPEEGGYPGILPPPTNFPLCGSAAVWGAPQSPVPIRGIGSRLETVSVSFMLLLMLLMFVFA